MPVIKIPEGFTPCFKLRTDQSHWIDRLESRGWKVSDEIKLKNFELHGWIRDSDYQMFPPDFKFDI